MNYSANFLEMTGAVALTQICLIALFLLVDVTLLVVIIIAKRSFRNTDNEAESSATPLLPLPDSTADAKNGQPHVVIVNNGNSQPAEPAAPEVIYVNNIIDKDAQTQPTELEIDDVSEFEDESVAADDSDNTDLPDDFDEIDENGKIVDKDAIAFKSGKNMTLDEAYAALSKEQKSFFDGLRAYAVSKDNTKEKRTDSHIQIKAGTKPLIKLTIRNTA